MPDAGRIRIPPGLRPWTRVMGRPIYKVGGRFYTADGYPYNPAQDTRLNPRSLLDQPPAPTGSPSSLLFDNPAGARPDQVGATPSAQPDFEPDLLMPPLRPAATAVPDMATPGGPLPPSSLRVSGPPPMSTPPAPDRIDLADLVARVTRAESGGRANAVSPVGAQGLMQLMPATGRELAGQIGEAYQPFDPVQNVRLGKRYLGQMLARYGNNAAYALAAYNWGPGNVDRWIKAGADPAKLPQETQNYIHKIMGTGMSPPSNPPPAPTQAQVQRNALGPDPDFALVARTLQPDSNVIGPDRLPSLANIPRPAPAEAGVMPANASESDRLNLAQLGYR